MLALGNIKLAIFELEWWAMRRVLIFRNYLSQRSAPLLSASCWALSTERWAVSESFCTGWGIPLITGSPEGLVSIFTTRLLCVLRLLCLIGLIYISLETSSADPLSSSLSTLAGPSYYLTDCFPQHDWLEKPRCRLCGILCVSCPQASRLLPTVTFISFQPYSSSCSTQWEESSCE